MAQLKGGTTGQILSKTSATDMAFTWITNDVGDITAVTAGTGISGGGTSGAVTITNSMATEITAAGDIIVGTGSGTFDNLPIGTTAQVLTADTTVSPYKVKWATPTATEPVAFWAEVASQQTFTASTDTKITFGTEILDSSGYFASSRFTPLKAGYYNLTANIAISGSGTGRNLIKIFKNGSVAYVLADYTTSANTITSGVNLLYFNGSTDYAEIYVYSTRTSPASEPNYIGGFQGYFVRS